MSWLISNSSESPKLAAGELICKQEKAMEKQKRNWVAVDIAKEDLQLQDDQDSWATRYDNKGLNKFVSDLQKRANPWVICEASGGYERDLVSKLHAASIKVCVVSPRLVRAFAISEGIRAKTDKIDAAVLLKFAQCRNLRPTPPPSKQRLQLIALMDRRSQLSDALAQEKNHLQNSSALTHASIRKSIRFFQREIQVTQTKIKRIIAADQNMHRRDELFQSISGVGEMTSWSFIAYLDELAMLKRNEVVALVGLAPFNKDSGKTKGKRHIYGGRAKVRSCLYMAVQSAARYNPVIKPYVQRLRDSGKPYKCVMVAAMRKLVIHMHSQVKNLQPELALPTQ